MIYFYSHLIEYESVINSLDEMEFSVRQKKDLAELVDSMLYHTILDLVLSNLSAEDKKVFLMLLKEEKSREEIMQFLKTKIVNIEKQIKETSENLKQELHEDMKQARKVHQK